MAPTFKSSALKLRSKAANQRHTVAEKCSPSEASSMDRLPAELCELVLQHLPAMFAWRCRFVCRSWQHYIEEILSRDWLIGSRLLMMYLNHPRMLVLDTSENQDRQLTQGDLILDLVARQDDFLVFKFNAASIRTLSQLAEDDSRSIRDFWPYRVFYASAARKRWTFGSTWNTPRKELKLYILELSVGQSDVMPDMRLLTLRASPSRLFSMKRPQQDFKLLPPDSLLVQRRLLFSKLFSEAENQTFASGLPFPSESF